MSSLARPGSGIPAGGRASGPGIHGDLSRNRMDRKPRCDYVNPMIRFFDMSDHDRLPWRFARENRSVLARLR
jgi:hypothetical protein